MIIYNVPTWINFSYAGGVIAFAAVRGGTNERLLALLYAVKLVNAARGSPLHLPIWPLDAACLAAALHATFRLQRTWPIFAAAAHLLSLATVALYALHPATHLWSYLSAQLAWQYVARTALLWGTATRRRSPSLA